MTPRVLTLAVIATVLGLSVSRVEPGKPSSPPTAPKLGDAAGGTDAPAPKDKLDQIVAAAAEAHAAQLIVSYPDPGRTSLGLAADRTLEAVQTAAAEWNFVLVDAVMPKDPAVNGTGPSNPVTLDLNRAGGKTTVRVKEELPGDNAPQAPGALLFRKPDGAMLLMLLVVETPTAGLQMAMLSRAAKLAPQAALVGPCFTGSLPALRQWLGGQSTAIPEAYSGTITGLSRGDKLAEGHRLRYFTQQQSVADAQMVEHWDHLRLGPQWSRNLPLFAGGDHIPMTRVVESSTGFGEQIRMQTQKSSQDHKSSQASTENLVVRFPWQISRLRRATVLRSLTTAPAHFDTKMELSDAPPRLDMIPSYSDRIPNSQEAALAGIAARLDEIGDDFNGGLLGITATDVLDTLFMTRFLRAAHRNERIVVFTADRLYSRAADIMPVTGILTVSTYPQFNVHPLFDSGDSADKSAQNQDDRRRHVQRNPGYLVFDSEWSQGIYVATRAALTPLFTTSKEQAVALDERLPLWLTITGRDGFWPLAYLDGPTEPLEPRPAHSSGILWRSLLCVALAALLLWQGLLWCAQSLDHRLSARYRTQTRTGFWAALTLLTAVQFSVAAFAMPVWLGSGGHDGDPTDRWLAAVAFWPALVVSAGLFIWTFRVRWMAWFAVLPIGFLAASAYFWQNHKDHGMHRQFMLDRSFGLSSGVSPALPLVLLAVGFVAIAYAYLMRETSNENRRRELTPGNIAPQNISGSWRRVVEACQQATQQPINRHWLRPTIIAVGTVALGLSSGRFFHSAEPWWYDLVFRFAAMLLVCLIIDGVLAVALLWGSMQNILQRLSLHPIRESFSALPADILKATVWSGNDEHRDFKIHAEMLGRLRKVERWAKTPALEKERQSLEDCLKLEQHAVKRLEWSKQETMSAHFQEALFAGTIRTGPALGLASQAMAEFIALRVISVIDYCSLQMRNRLTGSIIAFAALVLSLNSYPFGQERAIDVFLLTLAVGLGAVVIAVFAAMSKNETMSRLNATKAGELDWAFVQKVLASAALPLISVLTSYAPGVGKALAGLVQPAMEALKLGGGG